jgi:hypothetical protein
MYLWVLDVHEPNCLKMGHLYCSYVCVCRLFCSCSLWLKASIDILAIHSFLFKNKEGSPHLRRVIDVHLGYCKSGNNSFIL